MPVSLHATLPRHCLNFLPEPQGQTALRPVVSMEKLGFRFGRLSLRGGLRAARRLQRPRRRLRQIPPHHRRHRQHRRCRHQGRHRLRQQARPARLPRPRRHGVGRIQPASPQPHDQFRGHPHRHPRWRPQRPVATPPRAADSDPPDHEAPMRCGKPPLMVLPWTSAIRRSQLFDTATRRPPKTGAVRLVTREPHGSPPVWRMAPTPRTMRLMIREPTGS